MDTIVVEIEKSFPLKGNLISWEVWLDTNESDPLSQLLKRFGFSVREYGSDQRLTRLVNYKISLDEKVADAYKAQTQRLAQTAGFSDVELSNDPRLLFVLRSIIQAREHLATLCRKKATPEAKPNGKT